MSSKDRELDAQGCALLALLVRRFSRVRPGDPRTYIGYKEALDDLGLLPVRSTHGESLKVQGLNSLADWTFDRAYPAVTGLIIDRGTMMPGAGFFRLFGRENSEDRFDWWRREIQKSLDFDWSPHLR